MTLEPLLHAPLAVQIHVAAVTPAVLIGTYQIFLSRKGAPVHRVLGYIYLVLMVITAVSAMFIHSLMPNGPFGGFSPIHLLVIVTFIAVYRALHGARTHNIAEHKRAMIVLYVAGILIAGGLTFLPGRIMHAVAFGSA